VTARPNRRSIAAVLVALVAAAGVLAGCGDKKKTASTTTTTTPAAKVQSAQVPSTPDAPGATKTPKGKAALSALPAVRRAQGAKPRISGLEGQPTPQVLIAVTKDVGAFWQQAFNGGKFKFQPATTNVIDAGGGVNSPCGPVQGATASPGYCGKDSAINLPVPWFDKNATPLGNFAVAYPVAFLWGFHIQNQLGLTGKVTGKARILLSDCLAGIWTASVFQRKALQPGDLQAGAKLIAKISGSQAEISAHVAAFNKGFNGGSAGKC
jgi:hypothetical protein